MADLRLQIFLGAIDKVTAPFKRIQGSSQKTAQELARLQRQAGEISKFRELSAASRQLDGRLAAARQRVSVLARELRTAQTPTRALRGEFNRAIKTARSLGSAHDTQRERLHRLRQSLAAAGIQTGQLGAHERHLRSEIERATAAMNQQTRTQERLTAARERAERIKQRAQSMHESGSRLAQTGLGMYHGGRRALGGIVGSIAPGLEFDATMSKVQSLARLDKDSDDMKALRADARAKGASTLFSSVEVGQGQAFLAMAGFTPESILASTQAMLDVALAGGLDLSRAADITTNISQAFGIDSKDAAAMNQLADQLVTGFTTANVTLEDLGETMKYFAPIAKAGGVDTATSIAMAGMLGNVGIQGSMAGTTLREMTSRMAALPTPALKALDDLGVKTKDAQGNLRSIVEVIAEIDAEFKKRGTGSGDRLAYLNDIFGKRAMSGMSDLSERMGSGEFQQYVEILNASQGNAGKVAAIMADNLKGDLDQLLSAARDVSIGLFEAMAPALRSLSQSVTGLLRGLGQWIKDNPRLAKTLGLLAGGAAALVTLLGGLALAGGIGVMAFSHLYKAVALIANSGVLALLRSGLLLVGKAVLWLGRALMMNPLGLVITAIAVAAYFIYKYWEPITGFFARLWAGITSGIGWAVEFIKTKLSWTPLGMVLNNWEPIKAFLAALWDGILDGIRSAWDLIVGVLKGAWDVIAGIFTGDGGRIMDGLGGIWDSIQTFMSGWPAKMLQFGVDMLKGLINGIKNMAGKVADAITGAVSGAVDRFKNFLGIKSPSRLFAGLGDFTMQGYAGGIVRTQREPVQAVMDMGQRLRKAATGITLGVAGAAAPVMAAGTPVMAPTARSAAPAPAAAPMTINITINAPGGSAPDIAREVRRVLDQVEHERRARTRAWQHDYD